MGQKRDRPQEEHIDPNDVANDVARFIQLWSAIFRDQKMAFCATLMHLSTISTIIRDISLNGIPVAPPNLKKTRACIDVPEAINLINGLFGMSYTRKTVFKKKTKDGYLSTGFNNCAIFSITDEQRTHGDDEGKVSIKVFTNATLQVTGRASPDQYARIQAGVALVFDKFFKTGKLPSVLELKRDAEVMDIKSVTSHSRPCMVNFYTHLKIGDNKCLDMQGLKSMLCADGHTAEYNPDRLKGPKPLVAKLDNTVIMLHRSGKMMVSAKCPISEACTAISSFAKTVNVHLQNEDSCDDVPANSGDKPEEEFSADDFVAYLQEFGILEDTDNDAAAPLTSSLPLCSAAPLLSLPMPTPCIGGGGSGLCSAAPLLSLPMPTPCIGGGGLGATPPPFVCNNTFEHCFAEPPPRIVI